MVEYAKIFSEAFVSLLIEIFTFYITYENMKKKLIQFVFLCTKGN